MRKVAFGLPSLVALLDDVNVGTGVYDVCLRGGSPTHQATP
jgi:hypothetical protein